MSQPTTPNINTSTSLTTPLTPTNTLTPPTISNKRPLESATAEFLENGWELLSEVHSKKEYPLAQVKSMPIGELKGIYCILFSLTISY